MDYSQNDVICKCKKVTYVDIERALYKSDRFSDVEREFEEVQKLTSCSTGCGGCHDKIMGIISNIVSG
jgi:NAD(P)H-nitrite reductase large subunit